MMASPCPICQIRHFNDCALCMSCDWEYARIFEGISADRDDKSPTFNEKPTKDWELYQRNVHADRESKKLAKENTNDSITRF